MEKPPYHVPTMQEIKTIPWNGFNVVSTFSGCGGSSLGYRIAGFHVLWASEFIAAARDSYNANKAPYTILDSRDIREVSAGDILDAINMVPGQLDLFDGSPPCSSFSTAGKREKLWGKVKKYSDSEQRTDDLFFEFARLLKGIQPKVFIAENVKGLTIGTAKQMLGSAQMDMFWNQDETIYHKLCDAGYVVEWRVLNAANFGVPQSRNRCIFVGVRKDILLPPAYPKALGYQYTVRDAIPWITRVYNGKTSTVDAAESPACTILASDGSRPTSSFDQGLGYVDARVIHDTGGQFGQGDITDKPCVTIMAGHSANVHLQVVKNVSQELADNPKLRRPASGTGGYGKGSIHVEPDEPSPAIMAGGLGGSGPAQYDVEAETAIARFAIGPEWDKLQPGEQSEKYFSLVKPHLERPCPTITALGGQGGIAGVVHPTEKRKFTIAELRRICGFPDDFVLTGTYQKQWERLGRAVPPVMMSHVAGAVRDQILRVLAARETK